MVAREQHVDISKLLTTYKLFIKVVDPLVQICSLVAIIFRWDYPRLNIAMLVYSCISCFILYKVQLFVQLLFLMFAVCLGLLHARTGLLGKVLPMGQRATHRPSNGPSNDPSNVNIPSTTTSSTQPPTRLRQRRGETTGSRAACSPASSASSPGTASSATTTATPAPPGTGSASLSSTSTTATPSSVSTSHGQRSPCTQHKFQQQIDDFKLLLYNLNSNLEIAVNIIECSYNVIKWEVYSHSILFYTSLSIVLIGLNTLPLRYTVNACFIVLLCCQPFIHAYRNRMGAHSKKAHSPTGAHCDPSSAPTSTPSQSPPYHTTLHHTMQCQRERAHFIPIFIVNKHIYSRNCANFRVFTIKTNQNTKIIKLIHFT